jgi:hypothetical protein
MKIVNIVVRIVLGLLFISPILGAIGVFPPPTADMYNTAQAFSFISALFAVKYVIYIMAVVFFIAFVLTVMNKMAIVALLILPIVVNIISFHLFLDAGIFTAGAVMADVLVLLNLFLLWQHRAKYLAFWRMA